MQEVGRRSQRHEVQLPAAYNAPPATAAEEVGEENLAVQAPQGVGVNQHTPEVSVLNDELESCYMLNCEYSHCKHLL